MKVVATNKATGEIIDLPADTPEQIVSAWRTAQEYVKAADSLKDQLKRLVPAMVIGSGNVSDPIGNYQFRVMNVQRMTYDKSVMREMLDPDVFEVLLKPDKTLVDQYLKENLETLAEASTELRATMVAEGKPYTVIKLEKLDREEQKNEQVVGHKNSEANL